MTHTWLGAGANCDYWQGTDISEIERPKDGDTFLDVTDSSLYTYENGEWHQING